MIGGIEHLVGSGPLLLAIPVALAAGAVTFLSPCCLPLVPGYLSYLTGMSGTAVRGKDPAGNQAATAEAVSVAGSVPLSAAGAGSAGWRPAGAGGEVADRPAGAAEAAGALAAEPATASVRGRAVLGTLLFVLGFAAVFATEGVFFAEPLRR